MTLVPSQASASPDAAPFWDHPVAGLMALAAMGGASAWLARRREATLRREKAEAEATARRVRESERKFRSLFDGSRDGHLLFEGEQLVAVNRAAEAIFGWARHDAAASDARVVTLLREAREAQVGLPEQFPFELAIVDDAGDPLPLEVRLTEVLLDEDRRLTQMSLRDVREERQARAEREALEMQLRESQKLDSLGTLAGGVAHDFNNLLAVIRANAELALHPPPSDPMLRESLEAVVLASDRARDIVRQLLTFGRPEQPVETQVDLHRLVEALWPVIRAAVPSTVKLVLEAPPEPCIIRGDEAQLHQVVLNLCTNAEHAMRATNGGTLRVRIAPMDVDGTGRGGDVDPGAYVLLEVTDTGMGMPAHVRERIFEPFFTTKPVGEGTGLGLAVLLGIVRSHGGRVVVHSEEGVGTTFQLLFPRELEAATAAPARRVSGSGRPHPAAGRRVLLVDDEPQVARALARLLQRLGLLVQEETDPLRALAAFERDPGATDLLITDQTMPGLTGDELIERVHRLRPGLPVIVTTGFSHRLTPERLAALGLRSVLPKPVAVDQLAAAVEEALAPASRA